MTLQDNVLELINKEGAITLSSIQPKLYGDVTEEENMELYKVIKQLVLGLEINLVYNKDGHSVLTIKRTLH